MRVILPYTPPYDWAAMTQFLTARATPGVERVDAAGYHRTISVRGFTGSVSVAPMTGGDALTLDIEFPDRALLPDIVERVAQMFDVDSDPGPVVAALSADRLLSRACATHPGIRVPGAWDPFELAVRAILGQQISVRAATTIAGRIAERWGEAIEGVRGLERLFPAPASLADAPLEQAGIIAARAGTIRTLAQHVSAGTLAFDSTAALQSLREIAGIGDWTAQYVAMRALRNADAFPSGDLVLRRLAGNCTARALDTRSERWRPWRAYAVMLLWQSAVDSRQLRVPVRSRQFSQQSAVGRAGGRPAAVRRPGQKSRKAKRS